MASSSSFYAAAKPALDWFGLILSSGYVSIQFNWELPTHGCDGKWQAFGFLVSLFYLPLGIANTLTSLLNDGFHLVDEKWVLLGFCIYTGKDTFEPYVGSNLKQYQLQKFINAMIVFGQSRT
ncbi:hypothetical protein L2E82_15859 [Cichorium intybus]|uniref:Uncharacterized protein n=1 Tax=Cichorium intybus TaxID=13427 RepID=A0ACB9F4J3_CICIN|nr:hypothetical protein L2E82_15859 [Cichorium intybus]